VEELVDFSRIWAYFNRVSQNDAQNSGGGDVLHLSNTHSFNLKMGLGPRTNNYAYLMSLKLLLTFAREKGISSL
jgi:hypothetical protein